MIKEKAMADAAGLEEKAAAMKKLDGVGREHEEFKLKLDKELQVEMAQINIQKEIADAQAEVISNALQAANIDIVGGETMFFDQIMGQIARGKGFDRMVNSSSNIQEIKNSILGSNDIKGNLLSKVKEFSEKYGISSEDIKNLTVAGLLMELKARSNDSSEKTMLSNLYNLAQGMGLSDKRLPAIKH